jgi:hypothetical protein
LYDSLPEISNVKEVYASQLPVKMWNQSGKFIIQKETDEVIDYTVFQPTGQMIQTGTLAHTQEIDLVQGVYILRLIDQKKNVWSSKIITGNPK